MNRYCFRLQVNPQHLAEYRRRHAAVWPEMLRALRDAGWSNYSLFVSPEGLLIGYFESTQTFTRLQEAMASTEVNARWQADMAPFFEGLEGTPDTDLLVLEEVFHLETQLEAVDEETR